jgi:hypothetical protein
VGKGPYGAIAVGGANADVTIDAAGGVVHHGALTVAATATAPHVQFSGNARFKPDTKVNVTSAAAAAPSPPVAVALPDTDPPIAPAGNVAVLQPNPAPPAIAPPANEPPSAPVRDVPVAPPKPPPPLAGWHHAGALTWFDTLLHAHYGGSMPGALAPARPMSFRHDGITLLANQNQTSIQEQNLFKLLGLHAADTASSTAQETPSKTRWPLPLGP